MKPKLLKYKHVSKQQNATIRWLGEVWNAVCSVIKGCCYCFGVCPQERCNNKAKRGPTISYNCFLILIPSWTYCCLILNTQEDIKSPPRLGCWLRAALCWSEAKDIVLNGAKAAGRVSISAVPVWFREPILGCHPNVQDLGVTTRQCQAEETRKIWPDEINRKQTQKPIGFRFEKKNHIRFIRIRLVLFYDINWLQIPQKDQKQQVSLNTSLQIAQSWSARAEDDSVESVVLSVNMLYGSKRTSPASYWTERMEVLAESQCAEPGTRFHLLRTSSWSLCVAAGPQVDHLGSTLPW